MPYYCVLCTAAVSLLTYMSCSRGASQVFTWFQNLVTIAVLFTWISVAIAYLRFRKALSAQGIDRNTLIFKSAYQPYTAWFCLIFFSFILVFNGFWVFPSPTKKFAVSDFITAYAGVPIYFGLYLFWKLWKRTKIIPPEQADLHTGKAALDEQKWPLREPKNWIQRVWYFIA